ncbi:hypothetical protein EPUS_09381 [Endocarpon pusillum Z07020]|uniref:Uncharacterized protein n=1 Tax=Endocarpon pusillum (strain Z07020 / HMAS-L-300199) TaxID=1263415 RepID=U1HUQ7_ENDPU|nr:uncharacterized protein EPUS_09381 [Endocarpon pusillum Z07020]ERF74390.1 hypothetical protein EPUS_09381 [Endocarpon pusillum Z07020]
MPPPDRLGGPLATSLALTSPNAIHSVAVSEPIVDWVSLDSGSGEDDSSSPETAIPIKRKPKPYQYTSTDAKSLLSLRSQLFPKPDSYFDPFASPTLFLRAPGRDCPQPYLDFDDISDSEAFGPYDDDTHTRTHSFSSSSTEEQENPAVLRPVKRRKVLRRWPANGPPESADLPRFRVFVSDDLEGEGMVLRQQGVELVELMRKVCFYGQEKEVAEMRVGVDVLPGRQREEGMLGIEEAARWLAQRQEEDA